MASKELVIENANIRWKNFSGAEQRFNPKGNRNFTVFIDDPAFAHQMEEEGWPIKWLPPQEDGLPETPILKVTVKFDIVPPKIIRVTETSKLALNEETVGVLDREEIIGADIILSQYHWEYGGRDGIKAYLKTAYITVKEDPFERKYSDFPGDNGDGLPF